MKLFTRHDRIGVVLDTNIIISALIAKEGASAKVFEMLILGEIENYTSSEIISELKEVLERREITKRTTSKARQFIFKHYLNNSIQIAPKMKVHVVEHESDNKFIEVCLEAKAEYVITGDSHLIDLKEFKGIRIIRAKDFLEKII